MPSLTLTNINPLYSVALAGFDVLLFTACYVYVTSPLAVASSSSVCHLAPVPVWTDFVFRTIKLCSLYYQMIKISVLSYYVWSLFVVMNVPSNIAYVILLDVWEKLMFSSWESSPRACRVIRVRSCLQDFFRPDILTYEPEIYVIHIHTQVRPHECGAPSPYGTNRYIHTAVLRHSLAVLQWSARAPHITHIRPLRHITILVHTYVKIHTRISTYIYITSRHSLMDKDQSPTLYFCLMRQWTHWST